MDPLAKVRGFRHVSDSLPGMSGEIALARRGVSNEGGVVTSAARSDGEPATAPPRLTPDLYGGAQSAGLTPSVRPLREAAGRPEKGVA